MGIVSHFTLQNYHKKSQGMSSFDEIRVAGNSSVQPERSVVDSLRITSGRGGEGDFCIIAKLEDGARPVPLKA